MKDLPLPKRTDRWVRSTSGGFDWDTSRPLADQWPWAAGPIAPVELKHADLCTAIAALPEPLPPSDWQPRVITACDEFDEADTASREPWTADAETKSTAQIGKR